MLEFLKGPFLVLQFFFRFAFSLSVSSKTEWGFSFSHKKQQQQPKKNSKKNKKTNKQKKIVEAKRNFITDVFVVEKKNVWTIKMKED